MSEIKSKFPLRKNNIDDYSHINMILLKFENPAQLFMLVDPLSINFTI